MNKKLEAAAAKLCDVAAGSVEFGDWPKLHKAIENVENAIQVSDEPLRNALREVLDALREVLDALQDKITSGLFSSAPHRISYNTLNSLAEQARQEIITLPTDKISRWIGFIQGVLAADGFLDVKEERDSTRPIFHRAYKAMGVEIPKTKE